MAHSRPSRARDADQRPVSRPAGPASGSSCVGAGAAVTAHGIDTMQAGVRTAVTGKNVDTFTSQKLSRTLVLPGGRRNLGERLAIGVVGTLGTTAATKAPSVVAAARTGTEANAFVHLTSAEDALLVRSRPWARALARYTRARHRWRENSSTAGPGEP